MGHVFGQVCDFRCLVQAAYRAFHANRENADALKFMYNLEPELFFPSFQNCILERTLF